MAIEFHKLHNMNYQRSSTFFCIPSCFSFGAGRERWNTKLATRTIITNVSSLLGHKRNEYHIRII
jgi:hypothetical protein